MKLPVIALLIARTIGCPVYRYAETMDPVNTCFQQTNNTVTVTYCKESEVCKVSFDLGTCIPDIAKVVFPRDFCDNYDYICLGTCVDSRCRGLDKGSHCLDHPDCDNGLACISNICDSQIKIGESGCLSEQECENTSFCLNGKCVSYYSIEDGERSLSVSDWNYFNPFCKSGLSTTTHCIQDSDELTPINESCNDLKKLSCMT